MITKIKLFKNTYIVLIVFLSGLLTISSCSNKLPCTKIKSDKDFYRVSATAYSKRRDIAEEKAISLAKKNLIKEVSDDLVKKTGLDEKLLFDSLKKGIKLKELDVVCKKTSKKKGSFRCSIAIEMPVSKFSNLYYDK